ncbi:MAG: hypothetical protein QE279_08015 [Rhodoferax sp.]|nr:hypothetical protein [Rhodoferax sp.]
MQPSAILLPTWLQITLTLVPTVSALFAAVGLYLNYIQNGRTNRQARASLVAKFLSDFADDKEMQSIFYAIEYSKFHYDDNFHDSDEERKLDRLIVHFANLALAWKSGLLENLDIVPVEYFARRLLRDEGVKSYLRFLDNWSDHAELGAHPYQALKEMGAVLGA